MPWLAIAVAAAAGIGACLRYLLDAAIHARHVGSFPWGTTAINLSGSFLLGLLTGLGIHHGLNADVVTVLGAGLLGGYTTWSTYLWESIALFEDGSAVLGGLNLLGSLGVGLAAAGAGLGLALI